MLRDATGDALEVELAGNRCKDGVVRCLCSRSTNEYLLWEWNRCSMQIRSSFRVSPVLMSFVLTVSGADRRFSAQRAAAGGRSRRNLQKPKIFARRLGRSGAMR